MVQNEEGGGVKTIIPAGGLASPRYLTAVISISPRCWVSIFLTVPLSPDIHLHLRRPKAAALTTDSGSL